MGENRLCVTRGEALCERVCIVATGQLWYHSSEQLAAQDTRAMMDST